MERPRGQFGRFSIANYGNVLRTARYVTFGRSGDASHAPLSSGEGVARHFHSSYLLMWPGHSLCVVEDCQCECSVGRSGGCAAALDYYTKKGSVSICPGRLEKRR